MRTHTHIHTHIYVAVLLPLLLTAASCGEDRTYEYEAKTQHNRWVQEMMEDHYLWADSLAGFEPAWKDYFSPPADFLKTLTAKSRKSDDWSYIIVDTARTDPHKRGEFNHVNSYGLDYTAVDDPTGQTTRAMLRVLTVYLHSPAAQAGLRRGDYICAYDGVKVTRGNQSRMQKGAARELEVRHLAQDADNGAPMWTDTLSVHLGASRYVPDHPFPVHTVLSDGHIKVAYLLCTRLLPCPWEEWADNAHTLAWQDELDRTMAQMAAVGVDEFVLDLRLCNDGTLDMARRLASSLLPSGHETAIFAHTTHNKAHSQRDATILYNVPATPLALSRVFILTGSHTKGAAEWLIRALTCTMGEENVVTIGTTTAGQYVITEEVGTDYHIRLFPAVAVVTDARGCDVSGGIMPAVPVDEKTLVTLGEYGTTDEALLHTALTMMGFSTQTP